MRRLPAGTTFLHAEMPATYIVPNERGTRLRRDEMRGPPVRAYEESQFSLRVFGAQCCNKAPFSSLEARNRFFSFEGKEKKWCRPSFAAAAAKLSSPPGGRIIPPPPRERRNVRFFDLRGKPPKIRTISAQTVEKPAKHGAFSNYSRLCRPGRPANAKIRPQTAVSAPGPAFFRRIRNLPRSFPARHGRVKNA